MNFFLRKLDANAALGRLLSWISTTLAVYRGVPMLIGTILAVISLIASGIIIPYIITSEELGSVWLLLCLPAALLHLAVIIALIGIMMSEPLGRGYRE